MFVVKDAVREPLYVVVPYFNPWRWKSREKHLQRALKHFHDSGAVIVLVEVAFNRRDFTWADSGLDGKAADCGIQSGEFRHTYIPLRSKDELWLKENAINVAVGRLPHNWKQVAWLDGDVHFLRPNWVGECIHKLQHYSFLQMFSHARDLGPNYEMLDEAYPNANGRGFVRAWHDGCFEVPTDLQNNPVIKKDVQAIEADLAKLKSDIAYYEGLPKGVRVFPGLAWAATREAWDNVGGLLDFAIWGGGDWHMAHALIEKRERMMREDLHPNYREMCMQWFHRCRTHIRKNIGVMEGSILHHWHGRKTERAYDEKHRILAQVGFDPLRHLKRDYQGLYQLHDDRSPAYVQLRDAMRRIAKERNEDSIDT